MNFMQKRVLKNSKRIWHSDTETENQYAEFLHLHAHNGAPTVLRVSVSGDYTLFINGKYVSSNQYADFEYYKIYDEIDITPYLRKGENRICFVVWYFGKSGMRYKTPLPGLLFEIERGGEIVGYSSSNTRVRKSKAYLSGSPRKISPQLGYSFTYDSTLEDGWLTEPADGFSDSTVIPLPLCEILPRPTKRLKVGTSVFGHVTKKDNTYLVDFGCEMVGFPRIVFISSAVQRINVAYGECLENGHVKRFIGDRDFSFDYIAKADMNIFTSRMLRFACRYIEITCESPIHLEGVLMIPQSYPVNERKYYFDNPLDKKIYDLCVNTLRLSMMEHYVDCPWREQCLYTFDSRNQMLCGYTAFEYGNRRYAEANLTLMGHDRRPDNLLSICFPSGEPLAIPSFSLYYIIAVKEYLERFGMGLGNLFLILEKIEKILKHFIDGMKDGLVCRTVGENYWNFYDWSQYCSSEIGGTEGGADLMINCIFLLALEAYGEICRFISRTPTFDCDGLSSQIRKQANRFYSLEKRCYFVRDEKEQPTELVNALAILSGVASDDRAKEICESLGSGLFIPCSLSMKTFKYDALLSVNPELYRDCILDEIRRTYSIMLDAGSTTAWECIEGAEAFDKAGSLCHGWSAVPVHYYKRLGLLKEQEQDNT